LRKVLALLSILLFIAFNNFQGYARAFCHDSKCCGCCPLDNSGLSPCKCDVGNDNADKPLNVSAVTVSKVLPRFIFSPQIIHSQVLNFVNSGLFELRKFKPDVSRVSLTISTFKIPLRI